MKKVMIGLLFCLVTVYISGQDFDAGVKDAAQHPVVQVNPFIGTDRSDAPTVWEHFGGTYPGAVAPWGMVQLSPETRATGRRGYFHSDPSICYFTCIGHSSGYPSGSRGNVQLMFGTVPGMKKTEETRPGYYAVVFADDSKVEMTVTVRTGMFRYRSRNNRAVMTIADAGSIRLSGDRTVEVSRSNGLFIFNCPWTNSAIENNMLTLEFDRLPENELLVKVAFSMVDMDGSRKNMDTENHGWDFDRIKEETYRTWNDELNAVQIKSNHATGLAKFYTALYHSFLIPYIISDVDGRYRGSDRQIHIKEGAHEYGQFSTWDTFRSLHPLLCLLKPQRQKDMILSMLHLYDQRGYLPYTPMTGYHSIPVIVDSYLKGITGFDNEKAYRAMKKFLTGTEMPRPDTYKYITDGFLNDSIDISVSSTLDYAYNDWALSVFADLTGHSEDAAMFRQRSFSYRNLFDVSTGFMLPRGVSGFVRNPGGMGYKEADKWMASWFVPHNVQDLINLSGGDEHFVSHLQEAMQKHVVFDNETVLHYPYLFSYAGRPDLTCYWVNRIRENCYTAASGGIPGNDDLGSMSSWFVFSAMGFFPVCPGRPEYVLAMPLFEEIIIRQNDGKEMKITADPNIIHSSFSDVKLNGQAFPKSWITHRQIVEGGSLAFSGKPCWDEVTPRPDYPGRLNLSSYNMTRYNLVITGFQRPTSLTAGQPEFQVKTAQLFNSKVFPHQETYLRFTVVNTGETGVFPATIMDGEHTVAEKKVLVEQGATVTDSVAFRIYRKGKHLLSMSQFQLPVSVVSPKEKQQTLTCNQLIADVVVKKGNPVKVEMELQNISEKSVSQTVSLYNEQEAVSEFVCKLSPGEMMTVSKNLMIDRTGFHTLKVLDRTLKIRIYDHPVESCVLDVDFNRSDGNVAWDASGFENHGTVIGPVNWIDRGSGKALQINNKSLVAFPLSESLNITGPTVTLSAWVYPTSLSAESSSSKYSFNSRGTIDLFTNGDQTVFQINISSGQLSFFAGGWGRGKCTILLPGDWLHNWHHIAGVCTGKEIKLYLNGKLQQTVFVDGAFQSTEVPWNLGRNAELPYSRRFEGMFNDVKIFRDALSDQDIWKLYSVQVLRTDKVIPRPYTNLARAKHANLKEKS